MGLIINPGRTIACPAGKKEVIDYHSSKIMDFRSRSEIVDF